MIAWLMREVQRLILDPQLVSTDDDPSGVDPDRVCTMALNTSQPSPTQGLPSSASELRMESGGTRPISYEIGGTAQLRHSITITIRVIDGDPVLGDTRRDDIVMDLVLRLMANATLNDAQSPDALQELTQPMGWEADYTPLGTGLPESYAVLTLTADVDLAALRGR